MTYRVHHDRPGSSHADQYQPKTTESSTVHAIAQHNVNAVTDLQIRRLVGSEQLDKRRGFIYEICWLNKKHWLPLQWRKVPVNTTKKNGWSTEAECSFLCLSSFFCLSLSYMEFKRGNFKQRWTEGQRTEAVLGDLSRTKNIHVFLWQQMLSSADSEAERRMTLSSPGPGW